MRFSSLTFALLLVACSGSHTGGDDAGSTERFDECEVPTDCVVVPESCCGSCGAAARGDAVAVHTARAGDYRRSACDPVGGDCPACFMEPDPTLVATCEAGRCVVVDLQEHPSTECAAAADCRVRAVECCECGATITPSTVVAVSDPAAFEPLVCDPGTGCPECAPTYPDDLVPACEAGRCVVTGP